MYSYKNVAAVVGLSICGISLYLFRLYWKKDEDDTLVKTSKYTTLEMIIPSNVVKEVIGKEGSNIKSIEIASGARIHFNQIEGKRICFIKGSKEACFIAKNLIKEFIDKLPKVEEDIIYIPREHVAKMIGRGGVHIHEMSNISGAKINISQPSTNDSMATVTFRGTQIQLLEAKSLVQERLQKCIDQDSKLKLALSKREPRGPAKSSNNQNDNVVERSMARRQSLSLVSENPFEVYVSALEHPSKFWIQIYGPKAAELDRLVEEMTEFYNEKENRDQLLPRTIEKGDLVAAVFKYDNKWYRAEVLNVDKEKNEAELFYVDYGDTDSEKLENIFELRTDFLRLHFQAIECYMHNIEPVNGKWSEDAVDKFEEWTYVAQWKNLSAKIKEYTKRENNAVQGRESSPVPGVDLYDSVDGNFVSIGDRLVENAFATYKNQPENKMNQPSSSCDVSQ